jgi:PhzF family phenazine biosynthesis protein
MTRSVHVFQIDAFTQQRFTGNPAGVVLGAEVLNDAEMLAIARELNNADTAFVLPADGPDHDLRIRFFTPRTEAAFVGHATIAAQFVLSRRGADAHRRRQKQKAGIVEVEVRGHGLDRSIAIRQPAPALGRELNERERLAVLDALALSSADLDPRCPMRIAGGSSTRLMIGVRSHEQLKHLKPDFARLNTLSAQLGAAGHFVFTLQGAPGGSQTESRMFCPALGIPEDPVSGNAHGILGSYLAQLGLLTAVNGRAAFHATQGHFVGRPGEIDIELEFEGNNPSAVWIIGQAVEIFETHLHL